MRLCLLVLSTCLCSLQAAGVILANDNRPLLLGHYCNSLDPRLASNGECYRLLTDIGEGLVRVGPDGKPQPGVADHWVWSDDSTTLTIHLKTNRKWSDGAPVVAEDFALAWRQILANTDFPNALRRSLNGVIDSEKCSQSGEQSACTAGIRSLDDYRLQIVFRKIDKLFPLRTLNGALGAIPSHFYEIHQEDWVAHKDRPYNGVYRVTNNLENISVIKSVLINLVPNDQHPESAGVDIREVNYSFSEPSFRFSSIRELFSSESLVDITFPIVTPDPLSRKYIESRGWKVISQNDTSKTFIFFNMDTLEPELVESLKLMLSSPTFRARVGSPGARLVNRIFTEPAALEPFNNRYVKLELEERDSRVRALLARLGISTENPRIINLYVFEDPKNGNSQVFNELLAHYGVEFKFTRVAFSDREKYILSNEMDAMILSWYAALPDPTGFFLMVDWIKLSIFDEKNEALFREKTNEASLYDGVERLKLLHTAEEILVNEGAMVPLFGEESKLVHRDYLCNIVGSPTLSFPTMWVKRC